MRERASPLTRGAMTTTTATTVEGADWWRSVHQSVSATSPALCPLFGTYDLFELGE